MLFRSNSGDGFVLKKTLYKTLCSGDKKNDIQFPGFKRSMVYIFRLLREQLSKMHQINKQRVALSNGQTYIDKTTRKIQAITIRANFNQFSEQRELFIVGSQDCTTSLQINKFRKKP